MKKLEIYGVQEMDAKEMKQTDGGKLWWLLAAYVIDVFANTDEHIAALKKGFEAGSNF